MSFFMTTELLGNRSEILHSLWGILCVTFGKKNGESGQVRSRSHNVIRGTPSDLFLNEIVFLVSNLLPLSGKDTLCLI